MLACDAVPRRAVDIDLEFQFEAHADYLSVLGSSLSAVRRLPAQRILRQPGNWRRVFAAHTQRSSMPSLLNGFGAEPRVTVELASELQAIIKNEDESPSCKRQRVL